MTNTEDRRKSKRVALFDDFHVLDSQTGELLGYLRDVSAHGFMVYGTLALVADREYKLAIVFPEPVAGETILELTATCRWRSFDVKRGFHISGFQFGELAVKERHIVEQMETEYEFSASENRH
jgi:hypothetical protein